MRPVKILIVEDEFIISEKLAYDLADIGYEISNIVSSGEEALKSVLNDQPDLIIMDIILDGKLDGIETARQINRMFTIPVIYLTGHSEQNFFDRAKVTHPVSYLSKPYNRSDIYFAIELALFSASQVDSSVKNGNHLPENPTCIFSDRIFVKDNKNRFNKVDIADILWIEGGGSYSKIITVQGEFTTSYNLKTIEDKIKNPRLVRIHRSFLINLSRVKQIIGKNSVILDISALDAVENTTAGKEKTEKANNEKIIQIGPEYRDNIYKIIKMI